MSLITFQDSLAIDTNVFCHLIDCRVNVGSHINELLRHILQNENSLIVDDEGRILAEYNCHLPAAIKGANDTGDEIFILRAWMNILQNPDMLIKVPLENDQIMQLLRKQIKPRRGSNDRIFVYVAFKQNKILISNDHHDIVGGFRRSKRSTRRKTIMRRAKRMRLRNFDFMNSRTAHKLINICE